MSHDAGGGAPALLPALRAPYLAALHRGSGREADRLVEQALQGGATAGSVYLDLFQPVAYRIGELWLCNEWSVAEEHVATAIIERQMSDLQSAFRPERSCGRTLVIGCVEGELHRVGNRMVADFFTQAGWTVHSLGAEVPNAAFVAMTREMEPDLVGLTAQLVSHVPRVEALSRALEREGLGGIPVIAGGLPFVQHPEVYRALDVRFCGGDAAEAVRCARALFPEQTG